MEDFDINSYLEKISCRWNNDPNSREMILRYLEKLSDAFSNLDNLSEEDRKVVLGEITPFFAFNSLIAQSFRKKAGLERKDVAEIVGCNPRDIGRYERGDYDISYPPSGKIQKKYLAWLSEQGYNPFNL